MKKIYREERSLTIGLVGLILVFILIGLLAIQEKNNQLDRMAFDYCKSETYENKIIKNVEERIVEEFDDKRLCFSLYGYEVDNEVGEYFWTEEGCLQRITQYEIQQKPYDSGTWLNDKLYCFKDIDMLYVPRAKADFTFEIKGEECIWRYFDGGWTIQHSCYNYYQEFCWNPKEGDFYEC